MCTKNIDIKPKFSETWIYLATVNPGFDSGDMSTCIQCSKSNPYLKTSKSWLGSIHSYKWLHIIISQKAVSIIKASI